MRWPDIEILDLNDDYWALSLGPLGTEKQPTVFDTAEGPIPSLQSGHRHLRSPSTNRLSLGWS